MSLNHMKVRKFLLVSTVLCMLTLFTIGVKAQDNDVLNSAILEKEVTVDGSIGADEWIDANKTEMEPWMGFGAEFGSSYLYLKNDAEFLYILFDQADTGGDILYLVMGIDADADDEWTAGVDMSFVVVYNATAETPWIAVHQNASAIYANWTACCTFNSTIHPGMAYNGSMGTSGDISTNHPILEMKIPLNLIGVNGSEGGTVGFILAYIVIAGGEWVYINLWPSTAKWTDDNGTPVEGAIATWGDLVISAGGGPPPPPTEGEGLPIWVWPTVAVVVIVIIIVAVYMLRR